MPIMDPLDAPFGGWPDPAAAGRHLWHDFESETEMSADGSGDPDIHHLIIAEPHGEELATIAHWATEEHPIEGEDAELKRLHAQWIADALDRTPVPMPTLDDARASLAGTSPDEPTPPTLDERFTAVLAKVLTDRAEHCREIGRARSAQALEQAVTMLTDPQDADRLWDTILEPVIYEIAHRLTHP